MKSFPPDSGADPSSAGSLPNVHDPAAVIVAGSHLMAEFYDRPLTYRLRESLVRVIADSAPPTSLMNPLNKSQRVLKQLIANPLALRAKVAICSDVWYLNQEHLRALPTISVGSPNVNALSAYLADRLPSVFTIDHVLMVQMDVSDSIPIASCWGVDPGATAGAVDAFEKRFLEHFAGGVVFERAA